MLALLHQDLLLRLTKLRPDLEEHGYSGAQLSLLADLPLPGASRQYDTHLLRKDCRRSGPARGGKSEDLRMQRAAVAAQDMKLAGGVAPGAPCQHGFAV